MEKDYTIVNGELYHWGVKGMRWGHKKGKNVHPDYARAHSKKKVQEMSDDELKKTNNRLQEEKKYKGLIKKTNYGKKAVTAFVAIPATITAVAGAAKFYEKVGNKVLDKFGPAVIDKAGHLINLGVKGVGKIADRKLKK